MRDQTHKSYSEWDHATVLMCDISILILLLNMKFQVNMSLQLAKS